MLAPSTNIIYGLSEESLIEGCIRGKRDCQEQLYRFYSPKMFGICLRYASDYHMAEDILQEGFIKIFMNIDRYKGSGSFEGWLKRIFINTAIEQFRKTFRFDEYGATGESEELKTENAWQKLSSQDLLAMVQKLSPGYRTVFNMYAIEGYSHKEISELLNISEGTSKSQLARARVLLQKMLSGQD
jgi:RNA polymerase sigma factor (sigma-70 family)